MLNYPPEHLWPLYEKLPQDLKRTIFAVETADLIYEICTRNGVPEEKISEVAKYTGYVLLGVLLPDKFLSTLKEEVKLTDEQAEKVNWEISRFIFLPVRVSLEMIYKTEIALGFKPPAGVEPEKRDIYREPLE